MEDYRLFKVKDIPKTCIHPCYCILRVGKNLKSFNQIKSFENHMERKVEVINADKNISNLLLKGSREIVKDVEEYIKDCSWRKDGVIAKEMLLTASPEFFQYASEDDIYKWVELNLEFLQNEYGDNCVYANCHFDETSPHVNALIVSKFLKKNPENKEKKYMLSNKRYFGGASALIKLQDKYAEFMQSHFPILQRGIRNSRTKHTSVKHFYALANGQIEPKNTEEVNTYNLYLRTHLKRTEGDLRAYRSNYDKVIKENEDLLTKNNNLEKELKRLEENIKRYEKIIDSMKAYDPKNLDKTMKRIESMFEEKQIGG